jgi:HAD superfamily hydrolase (TIGR01509 family)
MIKAIIFDCFGVVVKSPFDDAYRAMGGDPVKDKAFIDQAHYASHSGRIPSSMPVIAAHLGISEDEWKEALQSHYSVNEDLLNYIQTLAKSNKVAMLTNVSAGGLDRFVEPGYLEQYFDIIVVSADIGYAKPESQAYEIVADRLGVRLDECIFTDDREEYIEGAQAVGMKTILYTDFSSFKKDLNKLL